MATVSESLGKTVEIMFDIAIYGAEKTYQKIKISAPAYLKALAKGVAIWFLIIIASMFLKAYTGIVEFAYIGVFLCFALAIILSIWGAPIGIVIGMLKGETLNPATAGSGYVRSVLAALFVTALIFLYVIEIPIENNPGTLPKLLICASALVIGIHLWGSWIPPKLYTLIVMGTIAYTTATLFGIKPSDYIFGNSYSTYMGKEYGSNEPIKINHPIGEFSEYITLNGEYTPKFFGRAEFLTEKSNNKPIVIGSDKEEFNIPSRTFRVRTTLGSVLFIPKNR